MFVASPSTTTDATDRMMPKARASLAAIRPPGIGRWAVRRMTASISRSYHILMAPAAPAPTAMHSIAVKASTGCRCPGATSIPATPEYTTNDITRGLSMENQSPAEDTPCPEAVRDSISLSLTSATPVPASRMTVSWLTPAGISGCGAAPQRCGRAAERKRSTPEWLHLRPSSCQPASSCSRKSCRR